MCIHHPSVCHSPFEGQATSNMRSTLMICMPCCAVCRQLEHQKVTKMLQRHPSKACLIRHRALSRHNRVCRRGPRHPPRASRAPLVWLKLGRVGPPCLPPVMMGVSSSQTPLSRRTPIPTGWLRHLLACKTFLGMCLLVQCPTQCACA